MAEGETPSAIVTASLMSDAHTVLDDFVDPSFSATAAAIDLQRLLSQRPNCSPWQIWMVASLYITSPIFAYKLVFSLAMGSNFYDIEAQLPVVAVAIGAFCTTTYIFVIAEGPSQRLDTFCTGRPAMLAAVLGLTVANNLSAYHGLSGARFVPAIIYVSLLMTLIVIQIVMAVRDARKLRTEAETSA